MQKVSIDMSENTKDRWMLTATIEEPKRRELWIQIFPYATVPILSIIPVKVSVPDFGECDAYMLDLDVISDEQREGVIRIIAKRFNIPIEEVRAEIDQGVPIIADDVKISISVEDSGFWDGNYDEDEDDYLDYEEDEA